MCAIFSFVEYAFNEEAKRLLRRGILGPVLWGYNHVQAYISLQRTWLSGDTTPCRMIKVTFHSDSGRKGNSLKGFAGFCLQAKAASHFVEYANGEASRLLRRGTYTLCTSEFT